MKALLAETALAALGVAMVLVPPSRMGFLPGAFEVGAVALWAKSFQTFIVPLCLIVISIWGKKAKYLARWVAVAWGVWLCLCSVRIGMASEQWYAGWEAGIVVSVALLLALGVALFNAISISSKT